MGRRLGEDGFDFAIPFDDDDVEEISAYDPLIAPDAEAWLALDDAERDDLVEDYHRRAGVRLKNDEMRTAFHVVVETQFAMGDEFPVQRVVERLISEGLDRHDALHAVAAVFVEHLSAFAQADEETGAKTLNAYFEALETLTAKSWGEVRESAATSIPPASVKQLAFEFAQRQA